MLNLGIIGHLVKHPEVNHLNLNLILLFGLNDNYPVGSPGTIACCQAILDYAYGADVTGMETFHTGTRGTIHVNTREAALQ